MRGKAFDRVCSIAGRPSGTCSLFLDRGVLSWEMVGWRDPVVGSMLIRLSPSAGLEPAASALVGACISRALTAITPLVCGVNIERVAALTEYPRVGWLHCLHPLLESAIHSNLAWLTTPSLG